MRVLSIGEVLWDVFPNHELLGGAALNFCVNLHRLGQSAVLLTAVGRDDRGRLARQTMESLGLTTDFVQVTDQKPTGVATVGTDARGEPQFVIPRPAAFDMVTFTPALLARLQGLEFDWLYFGTLLQMDPRIENYTRELSRTLPQIRCFYDMNLRTGHWNFPLVERLCHMASVLKLNETEAETLFGITKAPGSRFSLDQFCSSWASTYGIETICVTLGPAGCFVYSKNSTLTSPGYSVTVQDTVGAGDAFAAAFLQGYHHSWPMERTLSFANALGALVASRPGATPEWQVEECIALAAINKNEHGGARLPRSEERSAE
jgi:fructokinase